jgi:uncharacterized protein (DUF1330 family)
MVAYVVVSREKTYDSAELAIYRQKAPAARNGHSLTVRSHDARYEVVEGPAIEAIAILEFPTFEEAKAWYDDPVYREALEFRLRGGEHRAVIVEGL